MYFRIFSCAIVVAFVSATAVALTGSGPSAMTELETVSPALSSAAAVTDGSISATFSEPMLAPGSMTSGNYSVSGLGTGTLTPTPTGMAGGPTAFLLDWMPGEMRDGVSLTLTVSGVQDAVGNPINPAVNSASFAGMGTAPVFSNLTVDPPQARSGETVTLSFEVSELLDDEPIVMVNDAYCVPAIDGKGLGYVYEYTIDETDTPGMATITLSGVDLAGNVGSFSDNDALEILESMPGLPLYAWPAAILLLATGLLMLWRLRNSPFKGRSRGMSFFLFLLMMQILICATAFAQAPGVTSVSMIQSPDGTTGTKVDIYYDLSAPNGPCSVLLSLSKDGGLDGYSHPVTHYSGDIANVTTGSGKHIVWDIRADYPEENIPEARILVTADDGIVQHTLTYTAGTHGSISGMSPQMVNHGSNGTAVTAVADLHYHFVQWSDGVLTATRQDTAVVADKSVTATFAINTYDITCNVVGNGTCTADPATLDYGMTSNITVTPAAGWHIVSVADSEEGAKPGSYTTTPVTVNRTVTATFAINTYDVTCNVVGNGTCTANPATVAHGSTSDITVTPDVGWHIASVADSEEGAKPGSYTTTPVTANRTVTATFEINTYTITCNVVGNGTCVANPATVEHGSTSDITVTPDVGWHIVSIVDSEEGAKPGSYTTTPVTANRTVTATFAINMYEITCNVVGNGTCVANPATVEHGSTSDITVTPDLGWHIVSVVDSEEGAKPDSYTTTPVTANRTVTATIAINTYTLTYLAGPNGSVSGTTPQTVDYGSDGTLMTAVPDGGYMFTDWSDGVLTATRQDTNVMANITVTASFTIIPLPAVTSFLINNGAISTTNPVVTLNNTATNSPTQYMASESASFTGASWQPYGTAPSFTFSGSAISRTVYFKVRNVNGESGVVSDTIYLETPSVPVATGTFTMGRRSNGDDATYGQSDELPRHQVTLGKYQIGTYEVTNRQYCDILNWAMAQGYLKTSSGAAWAGTGDIYAGGTAASRYIIVSFAAPECDIQYTSSVFVPKTKVGLPGTTTYSTADHPMVYVSWYGSVAFCNWLSQMIGLTPCYNMSVALWPLTVAPPTPGGYRLPTEAEWERAAAWDGTKHWIYGFTLDTLTGKNRANYNDGAPNYVNPLGLTLFPYTTPRGWFNGVNVSPNGSVTTVNSVSPLGAYDMSGNAWEWCQDWYSSSYYSGGTMTNPVGPASGTERVLRGGSWYYNRGECRTARRNHIAPTGLIYSRGFRMCISLP